MYLGLWMKWSCLPIQSVVDLSIPGRIRIAGSMLLDTT